MRVPDFKRKENRNREDHDQFKKGPSLLNMVKKATDKIDFADCARNRELWLSARIK